MTVRTTTGFFVPLKNDVKCHGASQQKADLRLDTALSRDDDERDQVDEAEQAQEDEPREPVRRRRPHVGRGAHAPEPLGEARRCLDLISQQWDEALARLKASVER